MDNQTTLLPETSYGNPVVQWFDGPAARDAGTDGGQQVVLHGNAVAAALFAPITHTFAFLSLTTGYNFGPAQDLEQLLEANTSAYLESVVYGPTGTEYAAAGCRVDSHTAITCTTIPGTGTAHRWTVTVKGQTSQASTNTTSFAVPVLHHIDITTAATRGHVVITLNGTNLALNDPQTMVHVDFDGQILPLSGITPPLSVVNSKPICGIVSPPNPLATDPPQSVLPPIAQGAANTWHAVRFVLPDGKGTNKPIRVRLTSPAGVAYSNPVTFSYLAPEITEVNVLELPGQSEMIALQINGKNFGCSENFVGGKVLINENNQFTSVNWTHTGVIAHIPKGFASQFGGSTVQLEVGGQLSNTMSFFELAPRVSSLCL